MGCLQITIDSGCATFAEVQKRGKDFWNEFELYLSDLGVGIALDIALVGMLAPYVSFQKISAGSGSRARLSRAIQALPSRLGNLSLGVLHYTLQGIMHTKVDNMPKFSKYFVSVRVQEAKAKEWSRRMQVVLKKFLGWSWTTLGCLRGRNGGFRVERTFA